MSPADARPDASLSEFLHARALATAPRRLAIDVIGGAAVAGVASWGRPVLWTALASAGACLSLYGVWAAAERRLQDGEREMLAPLEFAWFATRAIAGGLGAIALLLFLFALLGLALGTWIS